MGYRVIRALARLLLGLFYRRIEVVGSEHIPARGPVIITANHHNSLVDPMLVMMAAPRPLVILAAAPLFRNPLIGPFLRLVGALPVLRRQEGVGDPGRNDAMFGAVAAALQGGGRCCSSPRGGPSPSRCSCRCAQGPRGCCSPPRPRSCRSPCCRWDWSSTSPAPS